MRIIALLAVLAAGVLARNGVMEWRSGGGVEIQYSNTPPLHYSLNLAPESAQAKWRSVFDGKSLKGWHVSAQTGHGTGGKWVINKGAIHGTQDRPGNGGIVITDAQFGDFEVELEMNNDYGPDSGLFLRSNDKGQAYQAMIDYHPDGNLMGVYGEGIGGFVARNFITLETPDRIRTAEYPAFPLPFPPERWPKLWK